MSNQNTDNQVSVPVQIPSHVAIIMDGNGRWAKKRKLPRTAGHKVGVDVVKTSVEYAIDRGIGVLTLFAFSSENWNRPKTEVNVLLELFLITIRREVKQLHKNGVRIRFLGDTLSFPEKLQKCMRDAESKTIDNTTLQLVIAVGYGGRWEIANATKKIAEKVASGQIAAKEINEAMLSSEMQLPDLPDPDLFIRTGGEKRISNFLMWELAYTELYFTDILWPDFNDDEFDKAVHDFSSRQRRFGKTSEQVESS